MFIDTHCHLSEKYYSDIESILLENQQAGVSNIIVSGCEVDSLLEVCKYTKQYDMVYATIGFHPDQVDIVGDKDLLLLEKYLKEYPKIVGIGEIGLDYHYDKSMKDKQIELFKKQLDLAEKLNLPVVIHSRDATKDTIEVLKKYSLKGVIHCFSGSLETALEYIGMGYRLGIGGVVTFKNSKLPSVIEQIPLEAIVLETDSPYLAPDPFRGSTNSSKNIPIIAEKIAEIKNISLTEVEKNTTNTANNLFDLPL